MTRDDDLEHRIVAAALHLKEHGWAVVDNVMPQEECTQYVSSVWEWLEGLKTGVSRADPGTWGPPHWPQSYRGVINTLEVAHADFVWRIRKHPRIRSVFASLWGDSRLLSSFDSINVMPPALSGGPVELPGGSWLHTDQRPSRKGVACIQGLVNLVDVGFQAGTGTLLVKDGSHDSHERFFQTACALSPEERGRVKDWYQFPSEELPFWEAFESVALDGRAGSMFLWDSRTVHSNKLPERASAWRHVVYCCMQPAALATPADLARKREAWDGYRITTHWPACNVEVFPDDGESYYGADAGGKPQRRAAPPLRTRHRVEDADLRRLAGVEPYPLEPHPANNGLPRLALLQLPVAELHRLLERC
ncbi:hypothetical protein WJX81_004709 [Elliptochloris bilobata]|uniref:Phytanoyl-CoA dioxygenase n=1 Tax=Elliptochloris bilobata TaxID=381761 RepID=A0AAW1RU49_9CHLO